MFLKLESGNKNLDGEMDKNGHMNRWNYTNFKSNLAMMVIYHPVKFEFDWTKHFQETEMLMDRLTDGRRIHQSNRRVCYMQPT